MKREFLQLAHCFEPLKHNPSAWWCSEKLDGCRAFWDGGISRGLFADQVPFANIEKDGRYVHRLRATGLWSRYGKPIQCPNWFLDQLPIGICLDGELWAGRGNFQSVMKTVKQLHPDDRWKEIRFLVIDSPAYHEVLFDSEINLRNRYVKKFVGVLDWAIRRLEYIGFDYSPRPARNFDSTVKHLKELHRPNVWQHEQERLPYKKEEALDRMEVMLDKIVEAGGEGLVLRNPSSYWVPQRTSNCLKFKPSLDTEGTVVGYYWGRETDRGSKLMGLMGALVVEWKGKVFKLSGFTDGERLMHGPDAFDYGCQHPGEEVPAEFESPMFPRGTTVTFTYRELTDDGVPKEARYLRKREEDE